MDTPEKTVLSNAAVPSLKRSASQDFGGEPTPVQPVCGSRFQIKKVALKPAHGYESEAPRPEGRGFPAR